MFFYNIYHTKRTRATLERGTVFIKTKKQFAKWVSGKNT